MSTTPSIATRVELPRGSETILLVDDFVALVEMTQAFLKQQGYIVHTALNGVEALKVLEKYGTQIDLLFTDVVMPLMGGPDLAQQVRRLHPRIKVLFASGYDGAILEQYGMSPGLGRFLAKPYTFEKLSANIREVIDASQTPAESDTAPRGVN